jgi:hypothetical protein
MNNKVALFTSSNKQKDGTLYIEKHLYNDLRWLLCSATVWAAYKRLVEEKHILKDTDFPSNFLIYPQHSVYLFARSLFEFFLENKQRSKYHYVNWGSFGGQKQTSSFYIDDLKEPLHRHAMHLQDRLTATNEINGRHINNLIVEIATEIIRLWKSYTQSVENHNFKKELNNALCKALDESQKIAETYQNKCFKSPFSY